jgi:Lon protease-like protein
MGEAGFDCSFDSTGAAAGRALQLHIFEDRYKRMIDHCVMDRAFGFVFRDDEGARRIGARRGHEVSSASTIAA